MMETPTLQNGDSTRQSQIGSGSLFDRKIEFHLARKPYSGVVNFDSKFQLETLNPTVLNGNLVREVKSGAQMVAERSEGVTLGKRGFDDPELSFGITFKRIGAGLENLGNTCFLNSVLQCLTYTEPLVAYLQSGRHQSSCQTAGFCALCAIQKHVSRALHATGRSLAPKDLVSNLRCISRTFRNSRQEDAHEYMVQLLESMHKCCLPKGVPSESSSAHEKSLVHKIFGGRLLSQVRCLQCSYCSNKYDPFLDLSLEIAKADNLQKALGHFTAKEQLDDGAKQYRCQQCKQKVRAVKQMTVHEAPYVLTIHLKRFSAHGSGQKIDKKVAFGPKLDLKPFFSGSHEGSLMYTLYGVLVHAGWSTRSGHYYCFVRTSTGMWYSLDDNRVVQVNERTVLDQKAYMLFYVRDMKISPLKKPGNVTLNERVSSQENNILLTLTKGLKGVGQNGSLEKHVGGELYDNEAKFDINLKKETKSDEKSCIGGPTLANPAAMKTAKNGSLEKHAGGEGSDNATKADINLKKETMREEKSGANGSTPENPASLETTHSHFNETPLPNGTKTFNCVHVIELQPPTKPCNNSEGSLRNGRVSSSTENSLKKDALLSADTPPSCSIVQYNEFKYAAMTEKCPQTMSDGCSLGESVTSDSTMDNPAIMANTTVTSELPSNLPISSDANDQMKVLDCNNMFKPKKRVLKPVVVTMRLSTNVMCGSSRRFLKKKQTHKKRSVFNNQSFSERILENTVSTSDSILVASTPRRRKEQSSTEKNNDPVKKELSSRNNLSNTVSGECKPKVNPDDAMLEASESVKFESSNRIHGDDGKHCINTRVEKVSASCNGLKRALEEPFVARWDGTLSSTEELVSVTCGSTRIGYVPDEWDEEYDRGKRKKLKSAKYSYDGTNPFQEIATSKATSRKSKKDQSSSANRPYRIL